MKRKLLIFVIALFAASQAWAQSVIITETSGWLESVIVKWQPVEGAVSYNVYYTGEGITDKKIDTQLIRNYGTYFRADILGLKAGSYTLKVVPVIGGSESEPTINESVTVTAQDRTGFAFSNGRVPGAYKADGTPKDNAVILYITENTKNTISMDVTGANANPCVGLQTILDGFKKGKDLRPLLIRLVGQITDLNYMLGGDIVIENNNNAASYITMEGVGDDATADGWGIRIKNASNVEVRNIGTMNCNSSEGDNIGLQQSNDYIWVHNCDLFYGDAGSDSDQAKGDGALDCKKSVNVTFSYNHFWDSGKCNLLGLSEGASNDLLITYHHNWYDHSDSRHPRVRYYSAHVYNNYYDGNAKYGAGSTLGSSVFMEGNYFRNCKYPMLTSMQGSDVWDGTKQANDYKNMPTFSSEDGGTIKAYNNYMTGQHRFVAYGDPSASYNIAGKISSTVDFDAYVVQNRNDQVPSTVKSVYGSNTYNNFDTNSSVMYSYTADSPEDAKTNVMIFAGRVKGGDFTWTFDNAVDDASYAVNAPLKAKLTSYKTSLVAVQGETTPIFSTQTLTSTTDNNQTVAEGIAIEPMIYIWGGDATDATVSGLPASGIVFVKDVATKTITVSGAPTANVSFSVTTSGSTGTPVTVAGTITLAGSFTDDMIHNFTLAGKNSAYYTIVGNLSDSKGTVTYASLTLTQCLKMESTTSIKFNTTQEGTLVLVFNDTFTGRVYVDGNSYNPVAGILSITLSAGAHEITKGDTSNLYYISLVYNSTGLNSSEVSGLKIYPNPVVSTLSIASELNVEKVELYNLSGLLVKHLEGNIKTINLNDLNNGSYLIKVITNQGLIKQLIIKK